MLPIKYETLKRVMFKLDPETAHTLAGAGLRTIAHCMPLVRYYKNRYFISHPILSQKFFGKIFHNPVGLAGGFDKNGQYIISTPALGFGFTEIGTVTPLPQDGNQKPRLFRLIDDESIQNAMGFNNHGADYMLKQLQRMYLLDYPVGINLGKNKITPENRAIEDYKMLFKTFKAYGDYLVLNISSPNTPGLRTLQNEQFIKDLFTVAKKITSKPVLLKIAPDMEQNYAIKLCQTAIDAGAAGIIATNTTTDYSIAKDSNKQNFGGLSGKVLQEKSYHFFKAIAKHMYGKTMLISVGGIDSAEEAYKRIKAGASLIQLYTPLIYHGPKILKDINKGLVKLLESDNYKHISEAVGVDWK